MNQKQLLVLLLLLSIAIVIANDFVFNDVNEIFNIGDELGSVLSNLSLAYISSYIFYIVVVELKENRDKKNVLRSVYHLTDDMVDHGYGAITEIMEACKVGIRDYNRTLMTRNEFFGWCQKCEIKYIPKNKTFGTFANPRKAYITDFIYNSTVYHVNKKIEKIFELMPFLDSEFIALLNKLRHCIFFKTEAYALTQVSQVTNIPGKKIGPYQSMFDYIEIVREIEEYNNRNHLKYK